jgi:hypothetical protein
VVIGIVTRSVASNVTKTVSEAATPRNEKQVAETLLAPLVPARLAGP